MECLAPNLLYRLPGFFNATECRQYREYIRRKERESRQFVPPRGRFQSFAEDEAVTNDLWDVIERVLPPEHMDEDGRKWRPVKCAKEHSISRYNPDVGTRPHYDVPFDPSHKYKFLIYLNDDFEGGETLFFHNDDLDLMHSQKPVEGMAILFSMKLLHQGAKVHGEKFIIGPRIVYEPLE